VIDALVRRNSLGLLEICVSGNAGFAEKGRDIVCAAVSAIAQTALLGLCGTPGLEVEYGISDEAGTLFCKITGVASQEASVSAEAIVRTMVLGLRSIEAAHGEFLRVKLHDIEEVSTCSS